MNFIKFFTFLLNLNLEYEFRLSVKNKFVKLEKNQEILRDINYFSCFE